MIRDAFSAAVTGGVAGAMAVLRAGFPERAWSTTHTRRTLRTRAFLGEVECAGQRTPNAHEALVSREVWEAAQPGAVKQYRKSERHALGGIARCADCDTGMIGTRDRNGGPRGYVALPARSPSPLRSRKGCYVRRWPLAVESWTLRKAGADDGPDLAGELAAAEGGACGVCYGPGTSGQPRAAAYSAGARARADRIDAIRTRLAGVERARTSTASLPAADVIATASPSELRAIAVAVGEDLTLTVRKGGRWDSDRVSCAVNAPLAA